jgi:2-dehydropantoate 2-reductase
MTTGDVAAAPRSYTVVGPGGIGGTYGGRLHAAGFDMRFLGRSDVPTLRDEGLVLESVWGDVRTGPLGAAASEDPVALGPSDVVLVCLKTTENRQLVDLLPPLVRPGTIVVMMQNGLGVEEIAEAVVGGTDDVTVLGGLCFVCSTKVAPGHVRHIDYGRVTIGEWRSGYGASGITDAVRVVSDDLAAAGCPVAPQESLGVARWKKLVWNVPYNGLSVVLRAGTDELMADPDTRALVRDLMMEVWRGAEACGHGFDESFVEQMLTDTEQMTPYAPSMRLDFDAGRPMEVDAIYAAPLAAAAAAGAELPKVEALWRQLRFLDAAHR